MVLSFFNCFSNWSMRFFSFSRSLMNALSSSLVRLESWLRPLRKRGKLSFHEAKAHCLLGEAVTNRFCYLRKLLGEELDKFAILPVKILLGKFGHGGLGK